MHEPYKMVAINLIASGIFFFGLIIYKYSFKKKINWFVLLLLISLLPLISLLRPGDYESGDFNIRIYHIMSFYDSLMEGHVFPSWAGGLNATYGNPLFIFNYSLPYYGVSFFHFIGFSFIESMKIFFGLTLYLSGIAMFLWIKKITANDIAAFVSGIFYVFAPYHLVDVHFRATLGESTVFAIAPLCFYFIAKYLSGKKYVYLLLISLSIGLLFLSHPIMAIVFLPIIILYSVIYSLTFRSLIYICLAVGLGIVSTAYSWMAFLIYKPFMFNLPTINQQLSFLPFSLLFYSPWRYGFLFQGPFGELSFPMGYSQIIALVISIYLLIKRKTSQSVSKKYLYWVLISLVSIFMMHPWSIAIWEHIDRRLADSLVEMARMPLIISFCLSVVGGYFALYFSKTKNGRKLIYLLVFIAVLSTILNWGHRRVIPEINDDVLRKELWKSSLNDGVAAYFINNKWADIHNFWFAELPASHLEIVKGEGESKQISRNSTEHKYVLNARIPVLIKENTLFFPGWQLQSNGHSVDIYPGKRGVIYAKLPKGLQYLTLTYADFFPYKVVKYSGIILSVLLWMIVIFYYVRVFILRRSHF